MERLVCFPPLSEHGIESARIEQSPAAALTHFKQVVSQLTFIEGLGRIPRPLQRLQHHPIQAEPFFVRVSGVVIIDTQSAWRGKTWRGKTEDAKQKRGNSAERSFHDRNCSLRARFDLKRLVVFEGNHQRLSTIQVMQSSPTIAARSSGMPSPIAKLACNSFIPACTS